MLSTLAAEEFFSLVYHMYITVLPENSLIRLKTKLYTVGLISSTLLKAVSHAHLSKETESQREKRHSVNNKV